MASRRDGNVETWMLFGSGRATRVDVGLHESGERGHSAKAAYVVKECDAAMKDAAERGRLAALEWFDRRVGATPAYRVSFDLSDVPAGQEVGGASGGLAFAVAVACKVHAGTHGAVAAVGELGSGLSGGPVRGVKDIEAKIEGALARLPAGGRLIYSQANDPEIPAGLREKLSERGVQAKAVASVDEALDWLFPSCAVSLATSGEAIETDLRSPAPRRSGASAWWVVAIGLAGSAAALAIWYERGDMRPPPSRPVVSNEVVTVEPDRADGFESGASPAIGHAAASTGGHVEAEAGSTIGPPFPMQAASGGDAPGRMDVDSGPRPSPRAESMDASTSTLAGAPGTGGIERAPIASFPVLVDAPEATSDVRRLSQDTSSPVSARASEEEPDAGFD